MYKNALILLTAVWFLMSGSIIFLMMEQEDSGDITKSELPMEAACLEGVKIDHLGHTGIVAFSTSDRRVLDYQIMDHSEVINNSEKLEMLEPYSQEDIAVLQRIVEAEAGGEDEDGRLLVANVVMNRVADEDFPDTIPEVVFQKSNGVTQFSPVANGRYEQVSISKETVQAVDRALSGEDISDGALYFAARKYADSRNMKWFDEHLTFLFQHGGHEFFK